MSNYIADEVKRIAMCRVLRDIVDIRDFESIGRAWKAAGYTLEDFDRHGATAIKREMMRRCDMKRFERQCG